ncbi:MAG: CTP synthase, partial [Deltaproteobacteria bacterium]|nr:CTP synthase [Deltaproteobacteria bacterium]
KTVDIGIIGKYVDLHDSYKSLHEALIHGGIANNCKTNLHYIDSEEIEKKGAAQCIKGLYIDAVLVPGGFGSRGIEGKILAIQHAREKKIPFFGICLGMQLAVIEIARNLCGLKDANSSEFNPETPHPVIDMMLEQRGITSKGGTMRLGAYPCSIKKDSLAFKIYGKTEISERHRHRYEVNNPYRETLEKKGVVFSGLSPDKTLVEITELNGHPYFIGCQFHPEFKSKPMLPHPLFKEFIKAAIKNKGVKGSRGQGVKSK